jgi:outer membrane protein assembly factor BamE (lipoprotein component of BamABCDE complex)
MIAPMQITTLGWRLPLRRPAPAAAALLLLLAMQGCVYRMPIQQGNHLDASTVDQVKPGMTRAQVRYLLGTPMVPGGFSNDRWDYDYYLKLRRLQNPHRAHATVFFKDELVDHVSSDVRGSRAELVSKRPVTAPSN